MTSAAIMAVEFFQPLAALRLSATSLLTKYFLWMIDAMGKIREFFGKMIYSGYFVIRQSGTAGSPAFDYAYTIFGISVFTGINLQSATNFISIFNVLLGGTRFDIGLGAAYISPFIFFSLFWFGNGGKAGIDVLISDFDAREDIDGGRLFKTHYLGYMAGAFVFFLVIMVLGGNA